MARRGGTTGSGRAVAAVRRFNAAESARSVTDVARAGHVLVTVLCRFARVTDALWRPHSPRVTRPRQRAPFPPVGTSVVPRPPVVSTVAPFRRAPERTARHASTRGHLPSPAAPSAPPPTGRPDRRALHLSSRAPCPSPVIPSVVPFPCHPSAAPFPGHPERRYHRRPSRASFPSPVIPGAPSLTSHPERSEGSRCRTGCEGWIEIPRFARNDGAAHSPSLLRRRAAVLATHAVAASLAGSPRRPACPAAHAPSQAHLRSPVTPSATPLTRRLERRFPRPSLRSHCPPFIRHHERASVHPSSRAHRP